MSIITIVLYIEFLLAKYYIIWDNSFMLDNLLDFLKEKEILVAGFGIEGQATYRFVRRYFPEKEIHVVDQLNIKDNVQIRDDVNVNVVCGEDYLNYLNKFHLLYPNGIIIKSPGISLKDVDFSAYEHSISSQTDLFLRFVSVRTVGVTGTKGKSTTSSLIYKMLAAQNIDVKLLGNIGLPIFDSIETIKEDTIVVLELSSHQLEYVKASPHIAIMTNIFPEHLDHYTTLAGYVDAKFNIVKHQTEDDYFLHPFNNQLINDYLNCGLEVKSQEYVFFEDDSEMEIYRGILQDRQLIGEHNFRNIIIAASACSLMGADLEKCLDTSKTVSCLPHRMEHFIARNINFYDDSIATIPEAVISCIEALKMKHGFVDTLIVGGMDREIELDSLIAYLAQGNVKNIICMPDTGKQIFQALVTLKIPNVFFADNLELAVTISKKQTPPNGVCVLSPAAASYGFYKNFQERGDKFKELAKMN